MGNNNSKPEKVDGKDIQIKCDCGRVLAYFETRLVCMKCLTRLELYSEKRLIEKPIDYIAK